MKTVKGEYDDFLYATIEHKEGEGDAPLSVLSVLARIGMDPWVEAARLASLPVQVAAAAMVKILPRLPAGSSAHAQSGPLAARLIALLPGATVDASRPEVSATPKPNARGLALQMVAYALLGASIFGSLWANHAGPGVTPSASAATSGAATPHH